MVDVMLIIASVLISAVIIGSVGMLIVYFGHPDDRNSAWFPKLVVLFTLYFACVNVLLLPFDVANATVQGGLDMEAAWDIAVYVTAIVLLLVVPFAYFYYENDNDPNADTRGCCGLIPGWNSQTCEGIKWALGFLFTFGLLLVIMYIFLHYADLPVTYTVYNWDDTTLRTATTVASSVATHCDAISQCVQSTFDIEIEVTFGVFLLAMMSFLGWFLFVVFAGIGLPALPFDLYNAWRYRPKPMGLEEYSEEKLKLGHRASTLKRAGAEIRSDELNTLGRKTSRKERREIAETFHRFENAVYLLKRDFFHLEQSYKLKGGNPFMAWVKLFVAFIGASMSLMWVIHICIFIIPPDPLHPFLNYLFMELELPGFGLFGVLAFACYSLWILMAAMKGNFRFGLRFACCRVFPMEMHNTLINSFLANSFLILLMSLVTVQFCAMAFPIYARDTQVDMLFGVQIRYLRFFTYFFNENVFIYALIAFVVLGFVWLFACPREEGERIEKELDKIMEGKTKVGRKDIQLAAGVTKSKK